VSFQFIMIKPKAVALGLTESFFREFAEEGLELVWQRRIHLSQTQIEFLYSPHKEAGWFRDYVEVMTRGDVVVSLWRGGVDVIKRSLSIRNHLRREYNIKYKGLVKYYDIHVADSEEEAMEQLQFLIGSEVDGIIRA